ncbi:MAG: tRNA (guanosine(46)-N7)-methyltransferase TrmB [Proteobacteria bacterium]|nr:tRNA (guanosine(46)-N7)-methyltransferase TrmB [Pseudomonadota bacterium]
MPIERTVEVKGGAAWHRADFVYPCAAEPARGARIIVEIGPGRGDFLFHLAESNPDASVVGIEIKGKRVDKIIRRIERRGLENVTVIQDDARAALPRLFAASTVDEIHIQFPDPWPKRRHAKHRPINEGLLAECARVLKPGGTLSFITDHRPYAEFSSGMLARTEGIANCYAEPFVTDLADAFPTFFSEKWKAEGRSIYYQRYRKAVTGDLLIEDLC